MDKEVVGLLSVSLRFAHPVILDTRMHGLLGLAFHMSNKYCVTSKLWT